MTESTTKFPAWNIERKLLGKESTWDYIDGCMIFALLEIYASTKQSKYLTFSDSYIDYRVKDDGTIKGYNKDKFNLDYINGAKISMYMNGLKIHIIYIKVF